MTESEITVEATSNLGDKSAELEPRPQERLLIAALDDLYAGRVLCNTAGRAQFARAMAAQHASADVTCLLLDLYQLQQAQAQGGVRNLRLLCQSDPPDERFDVVALALSKSGEAELARELLQAGHVRLNEGGQLIATTNNPTDTWLHHQMLSLFDKVSRRPAEMGVTYRATKSAPLRKLRRFECEFPCRDGERMLLLRTRPGVFSHRHVDPGARALLAVMDVKPGMRVLDIGCGSGVVAIAAAARAEGVQVLAIDSSPRAIEATRWAAEQNRLPAVQAELDADGRTAHAASFDLVLANPPYYSNFRIAELFLRTAAKALKPGGQLLVVTKRPEWYLERLLTEFGELGSVEVKRYAVVSGRRN